MAQWWAFGESLAQVCAHGDTCYLLLIIMISNIIHYDKVMINNIREMWMNTIDNGQKLLSGPRFISSWSPRAVVHARYADIHCSHIQAKYLSPKFSSITLNASNSCRCGLIHIHQSTYVTVNNSGPVLFSRWFRSHPFCRGSEKVFVIVRILVDRGSLSF